MADANQIRKVTAIIKQNQHRRYVVVSAPGKRSSDDIKVTDLLYRCYNAAVKGEDFEPALGQMHRMVKENPKVLDRFKMQMPNFPKMEPVHHLYGILAAVFLAAVFAWIVPLASTVMGLLSMVSLWSLLMKLSQVGDALGIPLLKVEAGIGLYAASFLILIGTAMNIATVIRPAVIARRERKKARK